MVLVTDDHQRTKLRSRKNRRQKHGAALEANTAEALPEERPLKELAKSAHRRPPETHHHGGGGISVRWHPDLLRQHPRTKPPSRRANCGHLRSLTVPRGGVSIPGHRCGSGSTRANRHADDACGVSGFAARWHGARQSRCADQRPAAHQRRVMAGPVWCWIGMTGPRLLHGSVVAMVEAGDLTGPNRARTWCCG
jgi:hypothetical protein